MNDLMNDLLKRPWSTIIPIAVTWFVIGWVWGSLLSTAWFEIAAWVLAVIAATMIVAAMIASGYETERRQHWAELEKARLRVSSYESGWRAEKQKRLDAEKALRIQNRLVKD